MNQINTSLLLKIASRNQIQILLCCLWLLFNTEFLIALMNTGQSIFDSPLQMGKDLVRRSCGENQEQLQRGTAVTRPQATNQSKWKVLRVFKETVPCCSSTGGSKMALGRTNVLMMERRAKC